MASMTKGASSGVWPDRAVHPGTYLREEIEARGMTQTELAVRMERPIQVINEVIRGRKAISEETALGLERVLGTPARTWLNLQAMYGLVRARLREEEALEKQADWLTRFPVSTMVQRNWIEPSDSVADQVRALLQFFGLQSFSAWDERHAALGFRLSPRARTDRFALHTWVRQGEIEGFSLPTAPYDAAQFRDVLSEIRELTTSRDFWAPMRELCASAGVALVAVREFPKTGAQGVTRWLTAEKALIQINLRYRWADIFWFTFFHEAFHVLRHPQREVFVDVRTGMVRDEREAEADRLAADLLIPRQEWMRFSTGEAPTRANVRRFATRVGVAPGIVIGRLQHEKMVPHSQLNDLRVQLEYAGSD